MKEITIDKRDKEILHFLQQDATMSIADIANKVGLSVSPCWRRIQIMEENGTIDKKVTLLNPSHLGLYMTVFVQVKAAKHDKIWLEKFAKHTSAFSEVTEFYRMSGAYDYLLKVQVTDMASFDHFYKRFIGGIDLLDVTSSFAMENIKYSTAMPLDHL
ncbi:Lrp/AsnC family transcriptional regulator [Glaciecola petra]|uniref:Lrp/AsnC family transcriptional regulator n=1 Tax=Glaciecola petra TaxID=3075602 RepID=A0ABU2ZRR3_9ALTE|nr:Lrp/AsnC family transcriptional regulator [Aestuariibacter sp. P117]MDT0595323.1 Lrp/AsnC family transcriptional regulator [Aestuariibacter sp. P117]